MATVSLPDPQLPPNPIAALHVAAIRKRYVVQEIVSRFTRKVLGPARLLPKEELQLRQPRHQLNQRVQDRKRLGCLPDGCILDVSSTSAFSTNPIDYVEAHSLIRDNIPSKENANQMISVFPYKVTDDNLNTAPRCINACQQYGFNAAGLEYGSQCCKCKKPYQYLF